MTEVLARPRTSLTTATLQIVRFDLTNCKMWISRDLEPVLRRLVAQRPAVVVTGARQTGKTSLLRHLFPSWTFVTLDLPSEAAMAQERPDEFLRRYPAPLIVDEVQYAPDLFRHLKRAIDQHRGERGQYALTGSQKFTLMGSVSESLAGRASILDLDTLSLAEVRRAYPDVTTSEHVLRGGFPELWEDRTLDATSFLRSYVATYLERDLRTQLRVTHLRDFERYVRACALRSGQLLNKADLARDVGISAPTSSEWLSALQASSQLALVEPWFANGGKSITKSPKLFLCDTGLLLFLLNLRSVEELEGSPLRGAIFETAVYCELRKLLSLQQELESLFFFRDRTKEVDFVIHRGGRFHLFECKWTEIPSGTDAAPMHQVAELLGAKAVRSRTIVCRTRRPFPVGEGVTAIGLADLPAHLASLDRDR